MTRTDTTKRGFTLVELLVVMGLMGALATISTSGYYAVVRGMEERGAMASATGIIRAAQQRARIDRVPTAIYFYNELVEAESSDDYARAQGVAIAVRMGGRISWVSGSRLYDEFSDLGEIYGVPDPDNPGDEGNISSGSGMRLYKMAELGKNQKKKLDYWIVGSQVVLGGSQEQHFIGWAQSDHEKELPMYAFVKHSSNDGAADWTVGDAYALEFSRVRLPVGYVFGTQYPTTASEPIKGEDVKVFDPEKTGETLEVTVDVYSLRPGAGGALEMKKVGRTDTDATNI